METMSLGTSMSQGLLHGATLLSLLSLRLEQEPAAISAKKAKLYTKVWVLLGIPGHTRLAEAREGFVSGFRRAMFRRMIEEKMPAWAGYVESEERNKGLRSAVKTNT